MQPGTASVGVEGMLVGMFVCTAIGGNGMAIADVLR